MKTSRSAKFIGTIRDLSETREIETQLRHAEKLKAIGQLTEGIAHDFNNLLTVILGNLRKLESRDDISSAASVPVTAALRATLQAGELAKNLFVFSRQTPLEPKIVDPAAVVSDVIEMLAPIVPPGAPLSPSSKWPGAAMPARRPRTWNRGIRTFCTGRSTAQNR